MSQKDVFYLHSPIGYLEVSLRGDKLYSIQKTFSKKKSKKRLSSFAKKVQQQLRGYFQFKRKTFSIPLVERGTKFQRQVWAVLQKIPYGQTKTYKDVSLKLGFQSKARAVGQACSKNPFLIVVPCHRVVAQKSIGGFALGLKAKKTLLSLENSNL